MRSVDFEGLIGVGQSFNFGNQAHRASLASTAYGESKSFTFGHYNVGDSGGVITVGGAVCDGKLYYAVSICSPLDNFSRKVGRKNVEHNFIHDKNSVKRGVVNVVDVVDKSPATVLKEAAQYYLRNNKSLPKWTRNEVVFRKK